MSERQALFGALLAESNRPPLQLGRANHAGLENTGSPLVNDNDSRLSIYPRHFSAYGATGFDYDDWVRKLRRPFRQSGVRIWSGIVTPI